MKQITIDQQLFRSNRDRLRAMLASNSIVIVHSNDIMPTNADGTMRFKQNSDLFYLTGIDQEETMLILYPDAPEERWKEMLFLRETNEYIAVWEGHKYTKDEARAVSGIEHIYWLKDLPTILPVIMSHASTVYLNSNEHTRARVEVQTRDARMNAELQRDYPLHRYDRLAPLMKKLRQTKSAEEIRLMSEACSLTEKGFRRVLRFVKPGVMEYEVAAEYAHEFMRLGSDFADYQPIIASGASACVLHYVSNDKECKDGDLLLMDTAAGYANYNADMTRTIPVNGRFSKRQRQVYDAVLRVFKASRDVMKPGTTYQQWFEVSKEATTKECIDLGLFTLDDVKNEDKNDPLVRKYFMHGIGHHLGLDVHDVSDGVSPFQSGNVWTCEPGIYIREEGIGIRLENNILITDTGYIDLMASIPIEAEEIEELMNS